MSISLSQRVFKSAIRGFVKATKAVSADLYYKLAVGLIGELDFIYSVPARSGPIRFKCLSNVARIRARDMRLREPDTLSWIETFKPDEVLWDIGCNIGVFTLYAAKVSGARVVAFDPLPQNYATLTENLALNGVTDRVQLFCVALSDVTRLAPLYVPAHSDTAGGAGCPFGDNVDNYGHPVRDPRMHPTLGYSVDDFIETFDVPFPNHVKIDIDGIQEKVITGARRTLGDARVRSVMIELQPENVPANRESNGHIVGQLEGAGFKFVKTVGSTPNMTDDRETSVTNNFFRRQP